MAELVFCARLPAADPDARPVTILGKLADLKKVPFPAVEPFLAPRVSETVSCSRHAASFLINAHRTVPVSLPFNAHGVLCRCGGKAWGH